MRSLIFAALWLSSVVTAELITITEWRKCSTSAAFPAPTYNSTSPSDPSSSSSFATVASARPTGSGPLLGSLGPGAAASNVQSRKVDFLFWLEFANAIRTAAKINTGGNTAFFVGSDAQAGPLAGKNVDASFTNEGIYQLANMLLNDSSIYYEPGDYGYVDALSNYLDNVDLQIKPTAKREDDLLTWSTDLKYAAENTRTQRKAAETDYADDKRLGFTTRPTFAAWVIDGNGQLFTAALNRENGIQSKIIELQNQLNGAKGNDLKNARDGLAKARSDTIFSPGYNMLASTGSPQSADLLTRCLDMSDAERKENCPQPSPFNVPAYDAQGYSEFVQSAQRATETDYKIGGSADITVDSQKSTSQYDFGQTSVGADVSGEWFYPYSASGQHTVTSETFSSTAAASSIKITVTWDDIKAITITPGKWNFNPGNFQLRSDAPPFLKQLVRPTQLIVATRVGYTITVGDELSTAIDTHIREVSEAGGGFRIFGITIGASASHTTETDTHAATFDSASRTLTVVPKDLYGAATLLGIVGSKITI